MLSLEVYFLVLALICLCICFSDYFYRKIHNSALLILLIFQVFFSPLDIYFTSFALVLGIGLILYALIFIGAGDIKYASVMSLTVAFDDILWAYITTSFAGGFLAVCYFLSRKLLSKKRFNQEGIPFGIAISIGFYLIILIQKSPSI